MQAHNLQSMTIWRSNVQSSFPNYKLFAYKIVGIKIAHDATNVREELAKYIQQLINKYICCALMPVLYGVKKKVLKR